MYITLTTPSDWNKWMKAGTLYAHRLDSAPTPYDAHRVGAVYSIVDKVQDLKTLLAVLQCCEEIPNAMGNSNDLNYFMLPTEAMT